MQIGLCTTASGDPALATPGLDFVEENVQRFLVPGEGEPAFAALRAAAAACPRPIRAANCFLPGALPCFGPAHDRARTRAWGEAAFRRARAAGIEVIVFGSGAARRRPDGIGEEAARAAFAELASGLADLAAAHGIVVAIEPLNRGECNFITSLADAAEIIARAPRPNLGILADLFHMRREDEGPEAIRRHGRLIRHVHIAEVAERTAPGVAGDDFRPWLAALREVGYDRTLSFECGWKDLAAQLPGAIAAVRRQLADAAGAAGAQA